MIAIASELLFKGMFKSLVVICCQNSSIKNQSVVSMSKNYLTFENILSTSKSKLFQVIKKCCFNLHIWN